MLHAGRERRGRSMRGMERRASAGQYRRVAARSLHREGRSGRELGRGDRVSVQ